MYFTQITNEPNRLYKISYHACKLITIQLLQTINYTTHENQQLHNFCKLTTIHNSCKPTTYTTQNFQSHMAKLSASDHPMKQVIYIYIHFTQLTKCTNSPKPTITTGVICWIITHLIIDHFYL